RVEPVVVRRRPGFGGSVGATLFFCLSLTPSLLPRHWALQAVVSGITMAIGYRLGAAVAAFLRVIWPSLPRASARARWLLGMTGSGAGTAFLVLGEAWQRQVRELVGVDPETHWYPVPIVTLALLVFGALLVAARAVRVATRRLAWALGRYSPRPVASVGAVGV